MDRKDFSDDGLDLYARQADKEAGRKEPEEDFYDPEFFRRFSYFLRSQAEPQSGLSPRTRALAVLAALLGCQGLDAFREFLGEAVSDGVSPEEIKETVYQAVAYLGIGRVKPFFREMNGFLEEKGISPRLENGEQTGLDDRLEKGEQAQVDIFGEHMRGFSQSGPKESRHINRWLSENCFGDYYTRRGLGYAEREMLTFCYLAAQGGCEPQLTAHACANLRLGNGKGFLIGVISLLIPYIGYPRCLNALRCVEAAAGPSSSDE